MKCILLTAGMLVVYLPHLGRWRAYRKTPTLSRNTSPRASKIRHNYFHEVRGDYVLIGVCLFVFLVVCLLANVMNGFTLNFQGMLGMGL